LFLLGFDCITDIRRGDGSCFAFYGVCHGFMGESLVFPLFNQFAHYLDH
jgi:hypothetical protein